MQSEDRLRQIESHTNGPLTVLAILLIPVLLTPLVITVGPRLHTVFFLLDWLIWAGFAGVFGLKLAVAPRRLAYLRSNWLEAAMVVLPFARPLRLLRMARVAAVLGLNLRMFDRVVSDRGMRAAALVVVLTVVFAGLLVWRVERRNPERTIDSPADGIWWTITTITTVGYGDVYPTRPAARVIAAIVMVVGIGALSTVTAGIAALLVKDDDDAQFTLIVRKLEALEAEVRLLRDGQPQRPPPVEPGGS